MTGTRTGGGGGRKEEIRDEQEGEHGSENGRDDNRDEDGGEREHGNLKSGIRGGSEDTRRRATPTNNQQAQPQDPTPQRDRRIMLRTTARGREARNKIREGGREAKKRKKPNKSCRCDVGNGVDLGGNGERRRQQSVD